MSYDYIRQQTFTHELYNSRAHEQFLLDRLHKEPHRKGGLDLKVLDNVYVSSRKGKLLQPTTPRKARLLLRQNKAKITSRSPFSIEYLEKETFTREENSLLVYQENNVLYLNVVNSTGRVLWTSWLNVKEYQLLNPKEEVLYRELCTRLLKYLRQYVAFKRVYVVNREFDYLTSLDLRQRKLEFQEWWFHYRARARSFLQKYCQLCERREKLNSVLIPKTDNRIDFLQLPVFHCLKCARYCKKTTTNYVVTYSKVPKSRNYQHALYFVSLAGRTIEKNYLSLSELDYFLYMNDLKIDEYTRSIHLSKILCKTRALRVTTEKRVEEDFEFFEYQYNSNVFEKELYFNFGSTTLI